MDDQSESMSVAASASEKLPEKNEKNGDGILLVRISSKAICSLMLIDIRLLSVLFRSAADKVAFLSKAFIFS